MAVSGRFEGGCGAGADGSQRKRRRNRRCRDAQIPNLSAKSPATPSTGYFSFYQELLCWLPKLAFLYWSFIRGLQAGGALLPTAKLWFRRNNKLTTNIYIHTVYNAIKMLPFTSQLFAPHILPTLVFHSRTQPRQFKVV